jgi:hypothetical protein
MLRRLREGRTLLHGRSGMRQAVSPRRSPVSDAYGYRNGRREPPIADGFSYRCAVFASNFACAAESIDL